MNLSGFGLFVSFLLISSILFYNYRRKQKDNKLLASQNQQINQQKEEITSQRDEIESKRNILSKQKEELENIHSELKNSISYALDIQRATLPSENMLKKVLPEHFIFFKPLSIVGGDFYWVVHAHQKTFIAAADCTGHGVPGGFMSMLGMSFLNEIVNREGIQEVEEILNRLRELVIESLHQKQTIGTMKDGMSIGICSIDKQKNILEFAGANTPMFIVKEKHGKQTLPERAILNDRNILEEIRPDFMPVSIHPKIRSFTRKTFPLEGIDSIYMSSDGYFDQFGGANYKKFGKSAFKEMLLKNSDKSMNEQLSVINKTFEEWKGNNEQIDDVMVIGVKVLSI